MNSIWQSMVLDSALDPHEGGVPLVQTVKDDGMYQLVELPADGDLADVVAWTSRDSDGDLIAEMGCGDIHGVDGFYHAKNGYTDGIGRPVFYDKTARRMTATGPGNLLVGSVVDVEYAFSLHRGRVEDRRRVHVASTDSIELKDWSITAYDAQVITINDRVSGVLRVYGSSQSDLLVALMPGEAVRWRYDGNQWELSRGPLYTAVVRLVRPRLVVTMVEPAQPSKRTRRG